MSQTINTQIQYRVATEDIDTPTTPTTPEGNQGNVMDRCNDNDNKQSQ